ncbi:MAG: hypothetical protein KGL54_13420 [Sphingomonadales bacterium]|nr:hypothetical protein [Sphingomonadales bacterium]
MEIAAGKFLFWLGTKREYGECGDYAIYRAGQGCWKTIRVATREVMDIALSEADAVESLAEILEADARGRACRPIEVRGDAGGLFPLVAQEGDIPAIARLAARLDRGHGG